MKGTSKRLGAICLLGFSLWAASPQKAEALPTLRFIIDGVVTNCADEAACDTIGNGGGFPIVQASVTIPGVSVTTTTGSLPSSTPPNMDIIGLNVQVGAGVHDVIMLFSQDGFNAATGGFNLSFGGTMSNPAGSTVSTSAYFDNAGVGANQLFCGGAGDNCAANGTLIGTIGPFGPGAFAGTTGGVGALTTPYSITQVIRLHTTGPGVFSGDFELTAVPEPASLLLLGSGLVGVATRMRRKQQRA